MAIAYLPFFDHGALNNIFITEIVCTRMSTPRNSIRRTLSDYVLSLKMVSLRVMFTYSIHLILDQHIQILQHKNAHCQCYNSLPAHVSKFYSNSSDYSIICGNCYNCCLISPYNIYHIRCGGKVSISGPECNTCYFVKLGVLVCRESQIAYKITIQHI